MEVLESYYEAILSDLNKNEDIVGKMVPESQQEDHRFLGKSLLSI